MPSRSSGSRDIHGFPVAKVQGSRDARVSALRAREVRRRSRCCRRARVSRWFGDSALLAVITFFAANTALAAESAPKEESTGFGAGAVIGAVAGGPVGAIIGAALGAKIGNTFYQRKKQAETLSADLNSSRTQVNKLERDVEALNGNIDSMDADLERLRTFARPELLSLMQAGIEMDLLFRTDQLPSVA